MSKTAGANLRASYGKLQFAFEKKPGPDGSAGAIPGAWPREKYLPWSTGSVLSPAASEGLQERHGGNHSLASGVDLLWESERQLKCDFVVASRANADNIWVAFEGVDRRRVNGEGDLVVTLAGGEVVQHRPRVYEQTVCATSALTAPANGCGVKRAAHRLGSSFAVWRRIRRALYSLLTLARRKEMKASLALILLLALGSEMQAATLFVAASGQFGSSVIADPLAAPGGTWDIRFQVESSPAAFGVDSLGFDSPFSNFTYRLNGELVNLSPDSIRFSTQAAGGLFTLFFGPESGFQNGVPISEFLFQGPQVFSGDTAAPKINTGDFLSTSWIYSSAINHDNHAPGSVGVIIAPVPIPEPLTGAIMILSAGLFIAMRLRLVLPHFGSKGSRPS